MKIGLGISGLVHATLILWALVSIQRVKPLDVPPPIAIAVSMVSPSELAAIAKGERNAKNLTSEGADGTAKKDPPKKVTTPPPPPKEAAPPPPPAPAEPIKTAATDIPPPPEPKKAEPPPPEPKKAEPPPGPSAEETKKLEEAILADQAKAAEEEARKKAAADAAAKAEAEKKRLAELERQKRLEEQKRLAELKKKRDEAKKKADAEAKAKADAEAKAKSFDPNDIMKKIETADDNAPKQALKDNRVPKPAQIAGTKGAGPKGPQAGDKTGTAPITKGEQNQLVAIMRDQLKGCWNINSGHPDAARMQPVFDFELNRDGSLRGEPVLTNPDNSPAFQDAANAARRALRCASPFKGLPPDKYEHWEFASFRFDPSQMFR